MNCTGKSQVFASWITGKSVCFLQNCAGSNLILNHVKNTCFPMKSLKSLIANCFLLLKSK